MYTYTDIITEGSRGGYSLFLLGRKRIRDIDEMSNNEIREELLFWRHTAIVGLLIYDIYVLVSIVLPKLNCL